MGTTHPAQAPFYGPASETQPPNGEWPACTTSDAVQAKIVNIVKNLKNFKIVKNLSV